jgi:hypothetical protein
MNRKAFLATLAAAITAPFVSKPKTVPTIEEWMKANPAIIEATVSNAIYRNCKEMQEKFLKEEIEPIVRMSKTFTLKGEDLMTVINKETRHRALLHKGLVSPNELRDHLG